MSLPATAELDLVPAAVYHHCDLSPPLTALITRLARQAYLQHQKAELLYWKDCAERIKREVESSEWSVVGGDTTSGGSGGGSGGKVGGWHVVVGSSFGSFVSYEARHCVFMEVGHMKVLVFKHG